MKRGYLSQYFEAVAIKRLSAVEASRVDSNQHEFNGVEGLRALFGIARERQRFPARFIYLNDYDEDPITDDGFLTWYDARARSAVRTRRSEHRLYFPTTRVSECATENDLLLICKQRDGTVLVIIAEAPSTVERQLIWLFGTDDLDQPGFAVRADLEGEGDRVGYAARVILEELGIEPEDWQEDYLQQMLDRFGRQFPPTREFSAYARQTLPDITVQDPPDAALMAWLDREELLFRTLERELVTERLRQGFVDDVDGFLRYSLSVQNRRKSRAGAALENHLQHIFAGRRIRHDRAVYTEHKSKPDFLFPGIDQYRDGEFPTPRLTVLASKSSCKDRWRQILTEANRIPMKHLITLETSISDAQTDEMQRKQVRLIIPEALQPTYTPTQREWLMTLHDFVQLVQIRQVGLTVG